MAPTTRANIKNTTGMAQGGGVHPGQEPGGDSQGINRRRDVTTEEKQLISQLYAELGNGHEVARRIGRGSTTVYNHLGLGRRRPRWDDDQLQALVDGYFEGKKPGEIARRIDRSPRAVAIQMCRHRKEVERDPKKRRALRAITMAFRAVRKADIFREVTD